MICLSKSRVNRSKTDPNGSLVGNYTFRLRVNLTHLLNFNIIKYNHFYKGKKENQTMVQVKTYNIQQIRKSYNQQV